LVKKWPHATGHTDATTGEASLQIGHSSGLPKMTYSHSVVGYSSLADRPPAQIDTPLHRQQDEGEEQPRHFGDSDDSCAAGLLAVCRRSKTWTRVHSGWAWHPGIRGLPHKKKVRFPTAWEVCWHYYSLGIFRGLKGLKRGMLLKIADFGSLKAKIKR